MVLRFTFGFRSTLCWASPDSEMLDHANELMSVLLPTWALFRARVGHRHVAHVVLWVGCFVYACVRRESTESTPGERTKYFSRLVVMSGVDSDLDLEIFVLDSPLLELHPADSRLQLFRFCEAKSGR